MKNKFIAIILIAAILFSLTFISAINQQANLPQPIMSGSCIDLIQTCSNCTWVNITSIVYPNNIKYTVGLLMNQVGTDYTYNFCDTSLTGDYIYNTCGNLDGVVVCEPVGFEVTPTGVTQGSILNNPLMLILVGLSIILLMLAFFIGNQSLGFISGIMFMVSGVYTMIYGLNNSTDMYTRSVGLVLIGLGLVFSLAAGYEMLKDSSEGSIEQDE